MGQGVDLTVEEAGGDGSAGEVVRGLGWFAGKALVAAVAGTGVAWVLVGLAAGSGPNLLVLGVLVGSGCLFQVFGRESTLGALVWPGLLALGVVGATWQGANLAEQRLWGMDHEEQWRLDQQAPTTLTVGEREAAHDYGDAVREMLSASQVTSELLFGFLGAFGAMLLLRRRWRHPWRAARVASVVVLLLVVAGLFVPFPLYGRWAGKLGCMTCTYHYREFRDEDSTLYNMCGGAYLDVSVSEGKMRRLGFGRYGPMTNKTKAGSAMDWELRSYLYRVAFVYDAVGEPEPLLNVAGFRSFDYLTQARFARYAQMIELVAKKMAAGASRPE